MSEEGGWDAAFRAQNASNEQLRAEYEALYGLTYRALDDSRMVAALLDSMGIKHR